MGINPDQNWIDDDDDDDDDNDNNNNIRDFHSTHTRVQSAVQLYE